MCVVHRSFAHPNIYYNFCAQYSELNTDYFRIRIRRRRYAGTEQRLPCGGFRGGRCGQELAGAAVRQGHVPRILHSDH